MRSVLWMMVALAAVAGAQSAPASATRPALTLAEKEEFLKTANVVKARESNKGITGTRRVTLSNGKMTHDASVQTIDEQKARYEGTMGTEINFRDTWKFNVAAFRLACLLGIDDMVPPSVERRYRGANASFTWWVDDVLMDEGQRMHKKMTPPNLEDWNRQMFMVRVFDQLIYNMDRNLGNLLIDKQWNIWMIDHSRAFRLYHELKDRKNLAQCDRAFLEKLKTLDEASCKKSLTPYIGEMEIKGILARRDKILAFFDQAGPSSLYDYSRK